MSPNTRLTFSKYQWHEPKANSNCPVNPTVTGHRFLSLWERNFFSNSSLTRVVFSHLLLLNTLGFQASWTLDYHGSGVINLYSGRKVTPLSSMKKELHLLTTIMVIWEPKGRALCLLTHLLCLHLETGKPQGETRGVPAIQDHPQLHRKF